MLRLHRISTATLVLVTALAVGAGSAQPAQAAEASAPSQASQPQPAQARPLRIVVTVPPLAGIVRELAPEGSQITTLLSPGKSEHGYEFTPAELAALGRADLIVYVGLDLEPQVDRFLSRNTRGTREVVQLARALGIAAPQEAKLDEHGHAVDAHDHAHDHDNEHGHHHAVDPHLWLDPVLVKQALPAIAKAIEEAIANVSKSSASAAPSDAAAMAARLDALTRKIDELDQAYTSRLAPFKGRAIVTHHAAFGRLAERYGLTIAEVIRPMEAVEPTPGQIAEVVGAIKRQNVKVIFVEPQFNPIAAQRIAQSAGVKLGTLDPLGDGDWFKMMHANLDELVAKLGDS